MLGKCLYKAASVIFDFLANKAVVKVKDIKSFDIFEPWPFDFFLKKLQNNKQIKYVDKLKENAYDVVISQTVLEHVADPIETSIKCINAAKINGIIIFGSDFYPIIKCHVPDTFYLRHTFNKIIITTDNPMMPSIISYTLFFMVLQLL